MFLHLQEYMDKKKGDESFFVGASKVLALCSFKQDTKILKQGDERICKGIDIKAKSKSFKIILHLHQCMVMDHLSFVLKWLGDCSWESWIMFVNMI